MEVILLQDLDRLGKAGSRVTVKDGYARNFLFPQGLGLRASAASQAYAQNLLASQARGHFLQKEKAAGLAQRLKEISCTIPVAVGAQGKLHGAVTALNIASALREQGIELDKHQLKLKEPITQLGTFSIEVKLHPEVTAWVKVSVARK